MQQSVINIYDQTKTIRSTFYVNKEMNKMFK